MRWWLLAMLVELLVQAGRPLVLYALLALFLAGCGALLHEYLDGRVNTAADVERVSPLRVLARVPLMGRNQPPLLAHLSASSMIAEPYQALSTGIAFAGVNRPIRRLQITSPCRGEGKSTTAVNLAIAMARGGKAVVLVDADLRAPAVHRLLDRPPSPGLAEVLLGTVSLEDALQATEREPLLVLPAGCSAVNPAELLESRAFDQVIRQLTDRADLVIVDTPSCLPLADPLLIAPRMDGVVLVAHAGRTRKRAIRQAIELLDQGGRPRLLGVLLNQAQPHQGGTPLLRPASLLRQ